MNELKLLVLKQKIRSDILPGPIKIGIHFIRQTKAKFDFHNICQILFDLMVAFDIIEDDNMDCILPFPMQMNGAWYSVDKNNPGAYITIL